MKEKLTKADVTLEVKEAVAELLARLAIAEVTREEVDAVQADCLKETALYDDLSARQESRKPERIFDPDKTYLSEDDEALSCYYGAVDDALKAKGIKGDEVERDFCPALIAESEQLEAEWALLDAAAEMLDLDFDGKELNDRLLCSGNGNGLEQRQKFLDLLVGMVVTL